MLRPEVGLTLGRLVEVEPVASALSFLKPNDDSFTLLSSQPRAKDLATSVLRLRTISKCNIDENKKEKRVEGQNNEE